MREENIKMCARKGERNALACSRTVKPNPMSKKFVGLCASPLSTNFEWIQSRRSVSRNPIDAIKYGWWIRHRQTVGPFLLSKSIARSMANGKIVWTQFMQSVCDKRSRENDKNRYCPIAKAFAPLLLPSDQRSPPCGHLQPCDIKFSKISSPCTEGRRTVG